METKSESTIHLAGQPYDIQGPYKLRHLNAMRPALLETMQEIAAAGGDVEKVDRYLSSMNSTNFDRLMLVPLFHALKSTAIPDLEYEKMLDMPITSEDVIAAWSVIYREANGLPRLSSRMTEAQHAQA